MEMMLLTPAIYVSRVRFLCVHNAHIMRKCGGVGGWGEEGKGEIGSRGSPSRRNSAQGKTTLSNLNREGRSGGHTLKQAAAGSLGEAG